MKTLSISKDKVRECAVFLLKMTFFLGKADQDSWLSGIARKLPEARSFLAETEEKTILKFKDLSDF